MINWIYEDPRLNPEQQEMLSQLPLTKAFLAPSLDPKRWVNNLFEELERIKVDKEEILSFIINGGTCFASEFGVVNLEVAKVAPSAIKNA